MSRNPTKLLSSSQFAALAGVNDSRVRQLILAGRIKSQKVGRAHLIDPRELAKIEGRKLGRPASK